MTNCLISICDDFLNKPAYSHFQPPIREIITSLENGLKGRFSKVEFSKTFALCTLLDPRFKNYGFQNDNAYSDIKTHVHNLIMGLMERQNNLSSTIEEVDQQAEQQSNVSSAWGKFDEIIKSKKPQGNAKARAIRELQMYLEDEMLPRRDLSGQWSNPSQWWQDHKVIYPHLAELYITKCNIVATSVPCERVFSKTGLIIGQRRCNLKARKVEQLTFLNANMDPSRFKF